MRFSELFPKKRNISMKHILTIDEKMNLDCSQFKAYHGGIYCATGRKQLGYMSRYHTSPTDKGSPNPRVFSAVLLCFF